MNNLTYYYHQGYDFIFSNPFVEGLFFAVLAIFVLKLLGFALRMAFSIAIVVGVLVFAYAITTGADVGSSFNQLSNYAQELTQTVRLLFLNAFDKISQMIA